MHSRRFIFTLLSMMVSLVSQASPVAHKIRQFPKNPGHSIQGMCITPDGLLIQGYNYGRCRIYDLNRTDDAPIAEFPLGSAAKDNHANAISLSKTQHKAADIPLIYVTGGQPGNGTMECHVERITKHGGAYRAQRIQLITLSPEFAWDMKPGTEYRTPDGFFKIWGAPTWLVDDADGSIYVFSAIYRTTVAYAHFRPENRYVATKLRLPRVDEGDLTLTRKDVRDQFVYDFDAFVTQSGCVHDSKIYYVFGFGRDRASRESSQLRVYDLRLRKVSREIDLADEIREELESCAFYKGDLYVMTQLGNLYRIRL